MTPRDWTPSDAADAADDMRDRQWWRRDSALCPWPNDDPDDDDFSAGDQSGSEGTDAALSPTDRLEAKNPPPESQQETLKR